MVDFSTVLVKRAFAESGYPEELGDEVLAHIKLQGALAGIDNLLEGLEVSTEFLAPKSRGDFWDAIELVKEYRGDLEMEGLG